VCRNFEEPVILPCFDHNNGNWSRRFPPAELVWAFEKNEKLSGSQPRWMPVYFEKGAK
jgi:hypothetical protein